jgi:hypothetical protein
MIYEMESNSGIILAGEDVRTFRKPCPNATVPTWTDPGVNMGVGGDRHA